MINTKLFITFIFIALSIAADAKNKSTDSVIDPLQETQQVLRDKKERQKAIQETGAKAKAADDYAEKVVGAQHKDDMYDLSADLMEMLQKESEGNPDKMMEILSEAQKDPEAFYNRFPAAQKEKMRKLIEKLPKQSTP